ncbi:MAG: 2-C-methyl-D-erythritol 4-phosphate cytidylyltransferase [Acidimicrobiales bacterium]
MADQQGAPVAAGRWGVSVWAVVVAGGNGARFGGQKQFAALAGREVLDWSLEAASRACGSARVVLVVPAGSLSACRGRASRVVAGGATRAGSVRAGLAAVPAAADIVVVHDAARPLSSPKIWAAVVEAVLAGADAAVPCVAVADTIKQRQADGRLRTLRRDDLLAVQTPQAFRANVLRAAHATKAEATDDAALVEALGGNVAVVAGEPGNLKVTAPLDLVWAEATLVATAAGGQP